MKILVKLKAVFSGLFFLTLIACNNPYGDLGAKLDRSSWMNIDEKGAIPFVRVYDSNNSLEMIVFEGEILGASDQFGALNIIRIINSGSSSGEKPRQDVYIFQGTYTLNGADISIELNKRYTVFYERMDSISISGNQTETDILETMTYSGFQTNSTGSDVTVSIDIDGSTKVYHRLDHIIDSMMSGVHTAEKAAQIHRLYQIPGVVLPQSRISGFGGMNMTNYTTPTAFGSLMNNPSGDHYLTLSVRMDFIRAITTFDFSDFCDIKPVKLNGSYVNEANPAGSGTMEGTVEIILEGTDNLWYCSLDYNGIGIDRTIANSGNYLLTIDGEGPFSIDFDNVNPVSMDFKFISDIISSL